MNEETLRAKVYRSLDYWRQNARQADDKLAANQFASEREQESLLTRRAMARTFVRELERILELP